MHAANPSAVAELQAAMHQPTGSLTRLDCQMPLVQGRYNELVMDKAALHMAVNQLNLSLRAMGEQVPASSPAGRSGTLSRAC